MDSFPNLKSMNNKQQITKRTACDDIIRLYHIKVKMQCKQSPCRWMVYFTEIPLEGCDYQIAIKRVYSFSYQGGKWREITAEWRVTTDLSLTEMKSLAATQRWFCAHSGTWWAPSKKKLSASFLNNINMMAQYWGESILMLQACVLPRTLMLSKLHYNEA
jgi:hypothetical protein